MTNIGCGKNKESNATRSVLECPTDVDQGRKEAQVRARFLWAETAPNTFFKDLDVDKGEKTYVRITNQMP